MAILCLCALPALAEPPLRIGVTGPFTGGSSPMGLSMLEGIRIAADEINAAGGVMGRPIELVERDDEARNEKGAQVVQELIDSEGVIAGLGIVNTGVALASQRYYQRARIPVITSVATGTLVTRQFLPPEHPDNFVFRISANDTIQAAMIVAEAIDRRGLVRVAIFHDATNYGQLGREDLEAALDARGVTPVAIERFELREADMTAQLVRARDAGAQAILTYGIGPELAQIANGMARLNWRVPMIGSWTLAMSNFIDDAGPNAEGARMPQTFIPEPTTPRRAAFLQAWRERTGSDRIPVPPAAAQGYDSLLLLAAAIGQARSTDGDRIREALEDLHVRIDGVVMVYDRPFSRDKHETITSTDDIFMGEVRNGRIVFAYEADRRRAAAR
ncbi:MAG TPA: ABC transporter substrate-binding protein [Rhodocyclaceae bacterium]|nr:ABC transporter substrate-binding protein [Rhodocyclaceae bacterium]